MLVIDVVQLLVPEEHARRRSAHLRQITERIGTYLDGFVSVIATLMVSSLATITQADVLAIDKVGRVVACVRVLRTWLTPSRHCSATRSVGRQAVPRSRRG
jgi:hypothetical protein